MGLGRNHSGAIMDQSRSENRNQFPECAKFVDSMREVFGPVTVTYVRENGIEKGKRGDEGVQAS
jgi:hypothetical protein